MANLARVRVSWTGNPIVGPGVSTFYVDEADSGFTADIRSFFDAIKGRLYVGTTILVPSSGDLIDVGTGEISGAWSDPNTGAITTTGTGAFAGGVGARVKWRTSGLRNGRRVVGSTFLVPLHATAYDASGTLLDTVRNELQTAAGNLLTAMGANLKIYSRPVGGSGGQAHTVIGAEVPDAVSWLRSRRT